MATIINTLEVVLDRPAAGQPPAPAAPPPAPALTPRDLEDVLERQAREALRLAAH